MPHGHLHIGKHLRCDSLRREVFEGVLPLGLEEVLHHVIGLVGDSAGLTRPLHPENLPEENLSLALIREGDIIPGSHIGHMHARIIRRMDVGERHGAGGLLG